MLDIDKMVALASKKYDKGVIFLCKKKNHTLLTTRVYPINICNVVIKEVMENVHHEKIENIIVYDKYSFKEVDDINDYIFGGFDTPQLRVFEKIASRYFISDYIDVSGINKFCIKISFNSLDDKLKVYLIDFLDEINRKNIFVEKFHMITYCNYIIIELEQ